MKRYLKEISALLNAGSKGFHIFIFVVFFSLNSGIAYSQLKITSNGNVGIDTDNPASRFSIGDIGSAGSKVNFYNSNKGDVQRALEVRQELGIGSWCWGTKSYVLSGSSSVKAVGLYASSYKSTPYTNGRSFGLYGVAGNATSGYNYGVYGYLLGSNNGAAVFGATPGRTETYINGIYAGYFRGMVYVEDKVGIKTTTPSYDLDVNGTIGCSVLTQTSDRRLKKDIKQLGKGNLLKIERLSGVKYKLKSPQELGITNTAVQASDTGKVVQPMVASSSAEYEKEHIGFIAQEVQKVFPDLVSEGNDGKLSVNYIGLIPVLVEAIKEQQAEIETLKKQVNQLSLKP